MTDNAVVHKRFRTMVNVLYFLSYVPLAISGLALFAFLGGIAATAFIPLNVIEDRLAQIPVTGTYESTGLTLEITSAYLETITLDQTAIILALVAQVFYFTAVTMIFYFVNRWLFNLRHGNIFTVKNIRYIALAGYTLMVLTVIDALSKLSVQYLMVQTFAVEEVLSELSTQLPYDYNQLNLDFNLMILFSGIIIWIIARVFKYGAFLQEEYDATV